jgi:hypothetical protein
MQLVVKAHRPTARLSGLMRGMHQGCEAVCSLPVPQVAPGKQRMVQAACGRAWHPGLQPRLCWSPCALMTTTMCARRAQCQHFQLLHGSTDAEDLLQAIYRWTLPAVKRSPCILPRGRVMPWLMIVQALDAALTKLHLRHKETSGRTNGHSDSSSLQQSPGDSDAGTDMRQQGAAAGNTTFDGASMSDATTAAASTDADGLGRGRLESPSEFSKGGGATSRLADAAVSLCNIASVHASLFTKVLSTSITEWCNCECCAHAGSGNFRRSRQGGPTRA